MIILAVFNGLFVYANLKIFYIFNSWPRIDLPNMIYGLSKLAQIRTETLHLCLRDDEKGRNQYVFLLVNLGNAFASKGMQKYHQHPQ